MRDRPRDARRPTLLAIAAGAARRLARAVPRRRPRHARSRRAHPGRPCARRSTTPRWWRRPTAASPATKPTRSPRWRARRLAREPVARILGVKEFWGLPLALNADTLVPRPETETVVEAALAALGGDAARGRCASPISAPARARCCWRCCRELPAAHGVGTDISVAALACARANAAALGLARPRVIRRLRLWRGACSGPFDLVVSNPPYVAQRRHRRRCSPRSATSIRGARSTAARTGLRLSRHRRATRAGCWRRDGVLVLELGAGQLDAVTRVIGCARGLRRRPRATTWPGCRGRCCHGSP